MCGRGLRVGGGANRVPSMRCGRGSAAASMHLLGSDGVAMHFVGGAGVAAGWRRRWSMTSRENGSGTGRVEPLDAAAWGRAGGCWETRGCHDGAIATLLLPRGRAPQEADTVFHCRGLLSVLVCASVEQLYLSPLPLRPPSPVCFFVRTCVRSCSFFGSPIPLVYVSFRSPLRRMTAASLSLLLGFFSATSAATIIGSVADWDPLAAGKCGGRSVGYRHCPAGCVVECRWGGGGAQPLAKGMPRFRCCCCRSYGCIAGRWFVFFRRRCAGRNGREVEGRRRRPSWACEGRRPREGRRA